MSKYQVFFSQKCTDLASAGRPDRSTELEVGQPSRSTDVHRCARQVCWRAGRPTRSTARELLLSGNPRSTGRELCYLFQAAVDRASRPTEQTSVFCLACGRPAGRPWPWNREQSSLPVDRGFLESRSSLAVDRVGRPALQQRLACTSVHVGRPSGRPTSGSVDRPGRPAEARQV